MLRKVNPTIVLKDDVSSSTMISSMNEVTVEETPHMIAKMMIGRCCCVC